MPKRPAGISDLEWLQLKLREADARVLTALAVDLNLIAARLRVDADDPIERVDAYRELYAARHALGKVVARYGEGVPPKRAKQPCGERWVAEIQLCPRCGFSAAEHV